MESVVWHVLVGTKLQLGLRSGPVDTYFSILAPFWTCGPNLPTFMDYFLHISISRWCLLKSPLKAVRSSGSNFEHVRCICSDILGFSGNSYILRQTVEKKSLYSMRVGQSTQIWQTEFGHNLAGVGTYFVGRWRYMTMCFCCTLMWSKFATTSFFFSAQEKYHIVLNKHAGHWGK